MPTRSIRERTREVPLDGGWGWLVVAGAFLAHAITHGIVYSFGVLFLVLKDSFEGNTADIALISSVCTGALYLIGPVASSMADRFGYRLVTVVGSFLCSGGYILSIFAPNLYFLCVTMGAITGCGFGMIFLPAIVVVTKYFHNNRAVACGIAISGCGIGALIFSPLIHLLAHSYGLQGTLLILAGIMLNCIPCGLLFFPLPRVPLEHTYTERESKETYPELECSEMERLYQEQEKPQNTDMSNAYIENEGEPVFTRVFKDDSRNNEPLKDKDKLNDIVIEGPYKHNADNKVTYAFLDKFIILKDKVFLIFLISQFLFFLGFYFPFVYLPDRAKTKGIDDLSAVWAVSTIGISSIVGRIVLGYVADRPSVSRLLVFKIVLLTTGVSTLLGPLYNAVWSLYLYAVIFGVSTGATLSMTSVVLVDFLGMNRLNDAFGLNNVASGIASLLGPPIAGLLFDAFGGYDVPFSVLGACMTVGGLLMCFTTCIHR